MNTEGFYYENTESVLQSGGGKIVRKVSIKNGKGYKSVITYKKGKKRCAIKKHIHRDHIEMIKRRKFIPRLFSDCKSREKTRKVRKH